MKQRALESPINIAVTGAHFGLNKELHQWLKDKHPKVAYMESYSLPEM